MKGFHSLEKGCPAGIPFSKCREHVKHMKHTKKQTKKRKHTRGKKKKKTKNKKHTLKRNLIPPRGVVIRKNDKLYRSNGRSLKQI